MNFVFGSTLFTGAAWLAAALARRASADLRSRIWRTALVAVAMSWFPWPAPESMHISVGVGLGTAVTGSLGGWTSTQIRPLFEWVWLAGAFILAAHWAASLIQLARLTRNARPLHSNIRVSDTASTPLTWGALRPVILLPSYALDWSKGQLDLALRHERAHIERRDWLWQTFGQITTALFWFQPLVWLAATEMRRESELAADDAVLLEATDAVAYAAQLVATARRLHVNAPAAALAMVRRCTLESRVEAILNRTRSRARAGVRTRCAVVFIAAALLVPLNLLQAAKTHHIGEAGLIPPKVASKVEPQYTEAARALKIQGTTTLTLIVNAKGQAEKIQVKKSLDKGLDAEAVLAVKQWHFEPGTLKGKPVPVAATIDINFHVL